MHLYFKDQLRLVLGRWGILKGRSRTEGGSHSSARAPAVLRAVQPGVLARRSWDPGKVRPEGDKETRDGEEERAESGGTVGVCWRCCAARIGVRPGSRYQVSEVTIYRWRDAFLAAGKAVWASRRARRGGGDAPHRAAGEELGKRAQIIGELSIANDI